MRFRARLAGALAAACAAVLLTASPQASAATSYWNIYNMGTDGAGNSLCITAGAAGGWAGVIECNGSAAQDWAFGNGPVGEYLVNRGRPGYVLTLSSLSIGAHVTLEQYDARDLRQYFAAGDPVRAHLNHIRPYYSPGLCLEARPWRTNLAPVVLQRCDTSSTGSQAWLSRFHGNY